MIVSYLKFLLRSTNQHGVHSPFVYDLVTKCFYDRKKYPAYKTIARYRRQLLQDKSLLQVSALGAGSRSFRTSERKISDIARVSGMNQKRARLLHRLVKYLKVQNALELGTSLGISTAAMAIETGIAIRTLEGCPRTAAFAREQFRTFGLKDISLINENFEIVKAKYQLSGSDSREPGFQDAASEPQLVPSDSPGTAFDLIFFDGNHQKQATLEYFEALIPRAHNDSVFIFDDIHWSKEMEEAWETIKAHPKVRVSIDTFQWGLVFFRKEQEKEHFVIRV